jgi:hypothetical protein
MRDIAVTTLKAGMMFSKPVYIDKDNMFTPARIPIKEKDLQQLRDWDIATVQSDGALIDEESESKSVQDARTEEKNKPVKPPSVISPDEVRENKGAYPAYTSIIEKQDAIFTRVAEKEQTEARVIDEEASTLLQGVKDHRDSFSGFIRGNEVNGQVMA